MLSHPPYHNIVVYSGNEQGRGAHPDDLSRCVSEDEFLDKLTIALKNQRDATRAGGYYGAIIGDVRRGGAYSSYQADLIVRMPRQELLMVMIKEQHNIASARLRYRTGRLRRSELDPVSHTDLDNFANGHEYHCPVLRLPAPASLDHVSPRDKRHAKVPKMPRAGAGCNEMRAFRIKDLQTLRGWRICRRIAPCRNGISVDTGAWRDCTAGSGGGLPLIFAGQCARFSGLTNASDG